jgi:hypothetical protein
LDNILVHISVGSASRTSDSSLLFVSESNRSSAIEVQTCTSESKLVLKLTVILDKSCPSSFSCSKTSNIKSAVIGAIIN